MAQLGSASALGAEGRGFKSRYPDRTVLGGQSLILRLPAISRFLPRKYPS